MTTYADPLDDKLSARAEVSVKGGTDRSVLTTEFWAPLAQQSGKVVYTDLRLMGDDDDNREGNLGIGYRQIVDRTDSVLGAHAWIDRRRTEHNSTFHQVTVGVESLGKVIDLRANGYVPLNSVNTVTTPNIGSATPYLAGSGLFFDTNGSVSETPQYGIDAEMGYRVPVLQKYTDTIRVYGGGYSFFRSGTDSITGYRVRTEAVINPALSVGARFQHDGERGSQTFLEATLRFPFKAKKLFQQKGLYGRLDESPERDVDIVTSRKVDTGLRKPIINQASGEAQRILYVDNSQANGDGTIERPFNNLISAQSSLQANDILYVKSGTGTTFGMDQGITISQPGVSLIGSGSALTVQGYTFLTAGSAPVITNTQGIGISALADNINISGITVNGSANTGIQFYAEAGQVFDHVNIINVSVFNTGNVGIDVTPQLGGIINNVDISNVISNGNAQYGVRIGAYTNGAVKNASVTNSTANNNGGYGIIGQAFENSIITNTVFANNTANNNGNSGIYFNARQNNSSAQSVLIQNNTTINNTNSGIRVVTGAGGTIDNVLVDNNISIGNLGGTIYGIEVNATTGNINTATVTNNTALSNGASGITVIAASGATINQATAINNIANNNLSNGISFSTIGAGSQITQLNAHNLTASSNMQHGVAVNVSSGSTINNVDLSSVTTANNLQHGISIAIGVGGSLGNISVDSVVSSNNGSSGLSLQANGAGAVINQSSLSNILANNNAVNGIYVLSQAGGLIGQSSVTNVTANNNTQYGLFVRAESSNATINSITVSNTRANNNKLSGVYLYSNITGIINSATLSNVTGNNNVQRGLLVQQSASGLVLNNVSVSSSSFVGNTGNGVYLLKQNTGGVYLVDLGGGGLSIGQNRIFGNTANDLNIDRAVVSAGSNWWNNGGAAPTRVTLSNGGSATYGTPLASDPVQ